MDATNQNLWLCLVALCIILGIYWAMRKMWCRLVEEPTIKPDKLMTKYEGIFAKLMVDPDGHYQQHKAQAARAERRGIMEHVTWEYNDGKHKITYLLNAKIVKEGYHEGRDSIEITRCQVLYVNGFFPTAGDRERYGDPWFPEKEALEFLSEIPREKWDMPRDSEFEGIER